MAKYKNCREKFLMGSFYLVWFLLKNIRQIEMYIVLYQYMHNIVTAIICMFHRIILPQHNIFLCIQCPFASGESTTYAFCCWAESLYA